MERKAVAIIGLIFIFIAIISIITNIKEDEEESLQISMQIEETQINDKILLEFEDEKEIYENNLNSPNEIFETQQENNVNENLTVNTNIKPIEIASGNNENKLQNYSLIPPKIMQTNNNNDKTTSQEEQNIKNNNNNIQLYNNNEENEEIIDENLPQSNNNIAKPEVEISENCALNIVLEEECKNLVHSSSEHKCLHEVGHKYLFADPNHICITCLNATQENACIHGFIEDYFALFPFLPSNDPENSIENNPQSHIPYHYENHLSSFPSIKNPANLTDEELTMIAERVERYCSVLPLDKQGDCYHGVGHPIYKQLNISYAEIVCSKLSKEFAYWNCIGGVYMTLFNDDKKPISTILEKDSPGDSVESYCLNRRDIAQCIYYFIPAVKNQNFRYLLPKCDKLTDERMKYACYMVYGRIATWWNDPRSLKNYEFEILKAIVDGGHLAWVHLIGLHESLTSYADVYCRLDYLSVEVTNYCIEQLSFQNHDYRKDLSIYSPNYP